MALMVGGCMTEPPPPSAYGAADDHAMVLAVRERLAADPAIARSMISVTAFRGQVTLLGTVPADVKAQATGIAHGVPGVRSVVDRLSVSPWSVTPIR